MVEVLLQTFSLTIKIVSAKKVKLSYYIHYTYELIENLDKPIQNYG